MKGSHRITFAAIVIGLGIELSLAGFAFTQNVQAGLPVAPNGKQWKLLWSDEFNGNSLDPGKWGLPRPMMARGSGLWDPSMVTEGGGVLRFAIRRENGKLLSAGISTENHFSFTTGYVEIRAKLPKAPGYRPAFWVSSKDINEVNSPGHPTEIDILEYPARNGAIHVNLHWNGYGTAHQTTGSSTKISKPEEWHTYGMWWTDHEYRFYTDGALTWTSQAGGVSTGPEFFRLGDELFNQDNLGNLLGPKNFPADDVFTVDYIRVYQLN